MVNKTVLDWVADTRDDFVAFSQGKMYEIIVTAVFLVLITQGRKVWMHALHFIAIIDALCTLTMPERYMGPWITGSLDDSHITLARCLAVLSLCWSLAYFFTCRSTDNTVESSFLLCYFVAMLLTLFATGYLMGHPGNKKASVKMPQESVNFSFYMAMLVTVGTLFHLARQKEWGGYGEISSHANLHLRIEFVFLIVMGVIDYALPQWSVRTSLNVEKVDTIHAIIVRSAGAFMIAMGLLSARAANFLRQGDKDAVVVAHMLFYIFLCLITGYDCFTKWNSFDWGKLIHDVVVLVVITVNAFGALDRDIYAFKRVIGGCVKGCIQDLRSFIKYKQL